LKNVSLSASCARTEWQPSRKSAKGSQRLPRLAIVKLSGISKILNVERGSGTSAPAARDFTMFGGEGRPRRTGSNHPALHFGFP
jgi:hypothetical protein